MKVLRVLPGDENPQWNTVVGRDVAANYLLLFYSYYYLLLLSIANQRKKNMGNLLLHFKIRIQNPRRNVQYSDTDSDV